MNVTQVVETLTGACMLSTPAVGYAVSEATDSPIFGGVAVLVATLMLMPVVRWMMRREDARTKESSAAAARREKREDDRADAFTKAMGAIVAELQTINVRIDSLPARIVKRCNQPPEQET